MSEMDNRKNAFESKFANDQEMMFKIEARCCKLFGLWMAEQLGLEGNDAQAYASGVVAANLDEPGFDDVKRHVKPDISSKGLDISDHILDTQLQAFFAEAEQQIANER